MHASSLLVVSVLALTCIPVAAIAQTSKPDVTLDHKRLLDKAMDNLHRARCGPNLQCIPVTPEERAKPPITDSQARAIVDAATISVMAEHCGLDWRGRNFVPLMKHHRGKLAMSERQMALVGLLHGITMGTLEKDVRATPCSPQRKEQVERKLLAP